MAARVWNAMHVLMSSLSDAYVARERSLGLHAHGGAARFSDAVDVDVDAYRSLDLTVDNRDNSVGAPRDSSALAQRDAWCAELRAAMLRFVAEDTRCREVDACFSEFLEEKMRIVGVASRNWLYPAECVFKSSAVYEEPN